jgi:hypothetical protein
MSKCSKSCNPNANFERLKEIDILLNCVMGIVNLEITHMNAPNSLGDVFQKAKSRLMYLIPGEAPSIVLRSDSKECKNMLRRLMTTNQISPETALKHSQKKSKPGGTLKAKVKTVSSVETVKAKAKKKGKA